MRELLRAGRRPVGRLLVAEGSRAPEDILVAARSAGVVVETAPAAEVAGAAGMDGHQGVVAFTAPLPLVDADALFGRARLLVALDGVTDPRNAGAVVRSAEVAGAGGVVLPGRRSAAITPAFHKAAAGAAEWLPIAIVPNLSDALVRAKRSGMWIVGLEAGGQALAEVSVLEERVVLLAGAEGKGLGRRVASVCDAVVGLPVRGEIPSLNVAAAVAVALFAVAAVQEAAGER